MRHRSCLLNLSAVPPIRPWYFGCKLFEQNIEVLSCCSKLQSAMLATQLSTAVRHMPMQMAAGKANTQAYVMNNIDHRSMQRLHSRKHLQATPTVCRGTLNATTMTSWFAAGTCKLQCLCSCDGATDTNGRVFHGMVSTTQKPNYVLPSTT